VQWTAEKWLLQQNLVQLQEKLMEFEKEKVEVASEWSKGEYPDLVW
jgi:hypothetical protein